MASANYDALHIRLSRMLGDPVAAAATDGKVWTSARRDILLNNAVRRWMMEELVKGNYNALREFRTREGQALTNNSKALSGWTGGVAWILSAYNSTDGVVVRRLPDGYTAVARTGENSYYTPSTTAQFYQVESGNFILLDGGTTTGDTIVLEYIKVQPDMTNAYASDIMVPSTYFGQILNYALELGVQEKPDPEKYPVLQDKAQEKVPTGVIGDK